MNQLVPKRAMVAFAARDNFVLFARKAFEILNPGKSLQLNWHHEAIAYHLDLAYRRKERRLLITMQPRSLKSELISVIWPAFALGHDPTLKFLTASYGDELAQRFARQCRDLMESDFYKLAFPKTRLKRQAQRDLETTMNGGRFSTSVGGVVMGRGGDIMILDDGQKEEEARSPARSESVWDWLRSTFMTRLDDKKAGVCIVVMQRLNVDDLAGRLMEQGGWSHLNLPAIAQHDEAIPIGPNKVHYRKAGDLLHPERDTLEVLEEARTSLGEYAFSAQFLQEPIPLEGIHVKWSWFKTYTTFPDDKTPRPRVVLSADFAVSAGPKNDYTAILAALVVGRRVYLIDFLRERLEYPDQLKALIRFSRQYSADTILIEKAGNGAPILAELDRTPRTGVPTPKGVVPRLSKETRLGSCALMIENGDVFLPEKARWLEPLRQELATFPTGRHDDMVDSLSMLLNWVLKRSGESQRVAFPVLVGPEPEYGEGVDEEEHWLNLALGWHKPTDTGDD